MDYIKTKDWYVRKRYPDGKLGYLHRWVWEQKYGKIKNGFIINHKNGNRADNRLANLEAIPVSEHTQVTENKFWNKKTRASVRLGNLPAPTKINGKKLTARQKRRLF